MPDVDVHDARTGLRRRNFLVRAGALAIVVGTVDPRAAWADAPARYVRATGNDALDGTTPLTAWRTVTRALALAPAGAVVNVGPGTYPAVASGVRKLAKIVVRRDPAFAGGPLPSLTELTLTDCENLRFEDLDLAGPT